MKKCTECGAPILKQTTWRKLMRILNGSYKEKSLPDRMPKILDTTAEKLTMKGTNYG